MVYRTLPVFTILFCTDCVDGLVASTLTNLITHIIHKNKLTRSDEQYKL
jgi:hypothetical protein